MQKKLKIGWFSFSCCEDSTIVFTELLNDYWEEWKKIIDFKVILPMQKKEKLNNLDIALVEGAITSRQQEEKLKKIRKAAQKLVAVGSCAVIGMPSSQRNLFDEKTRVEIEPVLIRFAYAEKVQKISDIVKVDDSVPGCPMDESVFLRVLNKYLKEFGIT